MVRQRADSHGIDDAQPLKVFPQNRGAAGYGLVADQEPIAFHGSGNLAAFSSGSSTKIQYALARPGVQYCSGDHGAGFLQIESAQFMRGRGAGTGAGGEIPAVLCPGDLTGDERSGSLIGAGPQRVDAQRQRRRLSERLKKVVEIAAEKGRGLSYKCLRKHFCRSSPSLPNRMQT